MSNKELSDKQQAFCREYMVDFNATQAAIRAGYSASTAQVQGSRLLSNAMIKKRVDELRTKAAKRNNIDVDQVIAMLLEDRAEAAALKQMGPAVRTTELIGKTIGAFTDRLETTGFDDYKSVVADLKTDTGPLGRAIIDHLAEGRPGDDNTIRELVLRHGKAAA